MSKLLSSKYVEFNMGLMFRFTLLLVLLFLLAGNVKSSEPSSSVIIFSATYCPSCLHAKKFFEQQGIAYTEFDIETSSEARKYFDRLGGRGTPLIYVNNKRMDRFNESVFWEYYKSP